MLNFLIDFIREFQKSEKAFTLEQRWALIKLFFSKSGHLFERGIYLNDYGVGKQKHSTKMPSTRNKINRTIYKIRYKQTRNIYHKLSKTVVPEKPDTWHRGKNWIFHLVSNNEYVSPQPRIYQVYFEIQTKRKNYSSQERGQTSDNR